MSANAMFKTNINKYKHKSSRKEYHSQIHGLLLGYKQVEWDEIEVVQDQQFGKRINEST